MNDLTTVDVKEEKKDKLLLEAKRSKLVEHIARALPKDGAVILSDELLVFRASTPSDLEHGISFPSLCLTVQGAKEVILGEDAYCYNANHYLITAAALPIESRVIEASKDKPCLGLVLKLEPGSVSAVIAETAGSAKQSPVSKRAFSVSPLDEDLLDAVLRLLALQDLPPDEATFLRPLIMREIFFRLLKGDQGGWLRHTAVLGGQSQRINEALELLRQDFKQPLRIADFAQAVGMSVSSFHHHFKAVTAMSPVQFQRRLRLQEARRLMLYEDYDAAQAGYSVGYEDNAYFSREYKRHFGNPPRRDVQQLKEANSLGSIKI
ncbi:MAG: AraC family transcriptional regulator [Trueperaceae bacterium]|nr:AraC family transcriptional regulator [Trueperaceae bacterium]